MKKTILLSLISCICLVSCNNKNLNIESFENISGRGHGLEYYQISNYENLSNEELMDKIDAFIKQEFLDKGKYNFTAYFYEKNFFINYKNHLNEDEIDSERGHLLNYRSKMRAIFCCDDSDDKKIKIYTKTIYDHDKLVLEKEDTISVK